LVNKLLMKKGLLAAMLSAALIFSISHKTYASTIQRLSGSDRYKTAIEVSKSGWKYTSDYVIIATGENFADALCATPIAKKYNAPILLADGKSLTTELSQELIRLKVKNVFIVGGEGAVSKEIGDQLRQSYNVVRLAGVNRYETSVKIAEQLGTSSRVVVATGESFPDALSIASIAGKEGMPILLTEKDTLPDCVQKYLSGKIISTTYIVGGQGVVGKTVEAKLSSVKRLAGADRYATNVAIVNEFINVLSFNSVFVATGENFPDALAGSSMAAKISSPIVLTNDGIPFQVRKLVDSKLDIIGTFNILGGVGAVADSVANKICTEMPRVVIDPGHGEVDSGAVGPTGVMEKTVNLAIALKLGQELQNRGIDVVFTRTTDNVSWNQDMKQISTDLQPRCDIANNSRADFFISVHNNSAVSSVTGTETYYSTLNPSGKAFADSIQLELKNTLSAYSTFRNRGVKTADYYVLKNTKIPAALVEVAFLSNPTEENLLTTYGFQQQSAAAIAGGIAKILN